MEDEKSESENDESDSESEKVIHASISTGRTGAGSIAIPGLRSVQINKLLDLATKTETMTSNSSLDKLQDQMSQLMADKLSDISTRKLGSSGASLKEIKALQAKLKELEKQTQAMAFASRSATYDSGHCLYAVVGERRPRVLEILSTEGHGHAN